MKYGSVCARELVLFADIYATLLRLSVEFKDPVHHQRLIRKGGPLKENLYQHLTAIKEILGSDHQLVRELQIIYNGIISRIPSQEAM